MKIIRAFIRFVLGLSLLVFLFYLACLLSGNSHLPKAVYSTYLHGESGPSILDFPKFLNREIKAQNPGQWAIEKTASVPKKDLLEEAEKWETTALIVVKKKEIIYEKYWEGFGPESLSNSFSMAKSIVSIALGIALKKGEIDSLNQKASDFLPELKGGDKEPVRIIDLLQMSSGIDFGESYGDPFGFMAKAYYGKELYNLSLDHPAQLDPGKQWKYQGGNTLLLSFVLEKASGKNLSNYLEKELWSKIGAENSAYWTISEEDQRERAYCCFYSNARDFARLGQLYLDSGSWNGQAIVEPSYVKHSTQAVNLPDANGQLIDYYGLHWWLGQHRSERFFYARGILGQYIVVFPRLDLVMVRLGHKRDKTRNIEIPVDLYTYLDIALDLGR